MRQSGTSSTEWGWAQGATATDAAVRSVPSGTVAVQFFKGHM